MYFVNIIFNKVGNATEVRIEYPQSQETNTKALRGKGHDVCTLASNDPEKQGVGMSIYKYIHMRQICIFIDKQGMYANRIKGLQRCMASHVFFVLFYFFQSSLYRFFFLIFKKSVIDFQCCTTVQQSDQVTHTHRLFFSHYLPSCSFTSGWIQLCYTADVTVYPLQVQWFASTNPRLQGIPALPKAFGSRPPYGLKNC